MKSDKHAWTSVKPVLDRTRLSTNLRIITDSAADLLPGEAEELGIAIAPLYLQLPERKIGFEDISPDEFYDRWRDPFRGTLMTTAPPSEMFADIYWQMAPDGQDILSLHISSGISNVTTAAQQGAEQSGIDATVVDTLTLSGGERAQVLTAALAARAGWDKEAILTHLLRTRRATEVVFILDKWEYSARGERPVGKHNPARVFFEGRCLYSE